MFFGTAPFGLPTLAAIADHPRHRLVGVVTGPDKAQGRGQASQRTAIGAWAETQGFAAIFKPLRLRDTAFAESLRALHADVFVVVAFRILPEEVFTIPRYAFNLHASLLPAYRGAAPIQRAIMAGETITGVTTFLLRKAVDTGAILGRKEVAITPTENAGTLMERMAVIGSELVMETLDRLAVGDDAAEPQNDAHMSAAPKIGPADQRLDFDDEAAHLINQVRALAPRPGTTARVDGRAVKVYELSDAGPLPDRAPAPGQVTQADPRTGLVVAARDRLLRIDRIQAEGKKEQSGAEFVRGYRIAPGAVFAPPM
ncbi:MAG TPA: methionyl-tRNA formyltransferase [Acidobacteriota bacterium]|nr:methionyl-tRNA formyltransferase [Acidobacteriota bacterium]